MEYLKQIVQDQISRAMAALKAEGFVPADFQIESEVERPANAEHGDFSTNIALKSTKQIKKPPMVIADALVEKLASNQALFAKVETAKPGFINLSLQSKLLLAEISKIRQMKDNYGTNETGQGRKLLLEFVSANPTGPLNIVSARAAAVGDALANILQSQGVQVGREFYINDAGKQAQLLGHSMYAFLKRQEDPNYPLPEGGYEKDYVGVTATASANAGGELLRNAQMEIAVIQHKEFGVQEMVKRHRQSLEKYGVLFDQWFSEKTLHAAEHGSSKVQAAVDELAKRGFIYEKEGAIWFASTQFGDDKDRVLKKSDGEWAYMAADIAYHLDKFQRGYTELVDLWGPDHHGYIARMKAAVQALGYKPEQFTVNIVQQVNLLEDGKPVMMSKRGAGKLLEMDDLLEDVGRDVARCFFLMRSTDAHLDFDLDLARKHSDENPVYYVQYAHARICSILKKAEEEKLVMPADDSVLAEYAAQTEELALVRELAAYPEVLTACAKNLEPHGLTFYLIDLATVFHRFYTVCRVVDPSDPACSGCRMLLTDATRIVLQNGLTLLGISAPKSM